MKYIVKSSYLLLVGCLLYGCDSHLLDTVPTSSVSSSTMWTTEESADYGVNGVYSSLRSDYCGAGFYWLEVNGVTAQSCPNGTESPLLNGTATPSSSLFSSYWQQNYEGIQRANIAIANLPAAPLDSSKEKRLMAECKFLRAWYYYNLNQVFQGVPLYLAPVDYNSVTLGKSSANDIWKQILTDLTDCINEPNLPDFYKKGDTNYGRVTKAAAYALRGKVYMWMKDYKDAESDLRKVGELGPSLYQGTYKDLFTVDNEECPEMIFSVQNIAVSGYGSTIQKFLGSRSSFGSDWNNIIPSPDFAESFEESDGKTFNWDDYFPGYDEMTPSQRIVYFLRDTTSVPKSKWSPSYSSAYAYIKAKGEAMGADMNKYLPVGNEERAKKAYVDRDPRLMADIITPYSTFLGANATTPYTYTLRWPFIMSDIVEPFDLRTDKSDKFYYLWRKWVYEGVNLTNLPDRTYGACDFPLIRYADVVLLLAEAINEQGFSQEAVDLVNSVRKRAGVVLLQTSDPSKPTYVSSQDNMRERIRNERRWELCMEGVDFFDELRWKTWKEKKFYESDGSENGVKEINGAVNGNYIWSGDYLYTWPTPEVEVERLGTSVMTPTSGWTY